MLFSQINPQSLPFAMLRTILRTGEPFRMQGYFTTSPCQSWIPPISMMFV